MNESEYIEQYKMMKRWYKRFENINAGVDSFVSSNYYQDDIYSFFKDNFNLGLFNE